VRYAVREALLAFRRAPLLAALGVATIAFSLFSLGLFGLVALNIRDALARVEERVEVRAFFADSTPPPRSPRRRRRCAPTPRWGRWTS
jgi:cell division transport system permease protein